MTKDSTRIIVVEDNVVYWEFVCNLLAKEGFRTEKAFHLSRAKKLLQQASDEDIVVSDLCLLASMYQLVALNTQGEQKFIFHQIRIYDIQK